MKRKLLESGTHVSALVKWRMFWTDNPRLSDLGQKCVIFTPKSDKLVSGSPSQNVLKIDLRNSQICSIWANSDPLWAQICHQ